MSPAITPTLTDRSAPTAKCSSASSIQADAVWLKALARERLRNHTHFRGHDEELQLDVHGDRLTLSGRLPSFYLKQLLQSILKGLPGVSSIDNRVDVVRWDGLSSEPSGEYLKKTK